MKLPGNVVGELVERISDSYTVDELQMFLMIHLEKDLDNLSPTSHNKPLRIFKMIETSGRKGWTCDLLEKLRDQSENPDLKDLTGDLFGEYCGGHGTPLSDDQIWDLCRQIHLSLTVEQLETFVTNRLERDLGKISSARRPKASRIFQLVDVSQKEGWSQELISALESEFPSNPKFAALASGRLASPLPPTSARPGTLLSGSQMRLLCATIGNAFDASSFAMFLRFNLDLKLDDVATPGTRPLRIFKAVEHAEQNGWLVDLLSKLEAAGPNEEIRDIAKALAAEISWTRTRSAGR